ncbi:hypothetical protein T440DRAFT_511293 [Plenodomus tracheiphilus IPT5]|uniref:Ubiquitin-like protease family profile domain-containing protein n=1 Tax=Plenodomus tracheiphilus IPT5 TaxID=1408161 RepID=A0A6A7AUQ4_9PLEO|nr:hypothetical protein T440DRAFT_511293 [Plenodomus tracheiphilus IPT5]
MTYPDNSQRLDDAHTTLLKVAYSYFPGLLEAHPLWSTYEPPPTTHTTDTISNSNRCYENATTSLHDPSYKTIAQTGVSGWFQDEIIDTSFDILERICRCADHKIALANTASTSEFFKFGEQVLATPDVEVETYKHPRWDSEMLLKFKDKDFIILPISDGYPILLDPDREYKMAEYNDDEDNNNPHFRGAHWSLLILDCRTTTIKARYLDSTSITTNALQTLRRGTSSHECGTEHTASDQEHNNMCARDDGSGACGPFLYQMAKEFVQFTVECREDACQDEETVIGVDVDVDVDTYCVTP